MEKIAHLVCTYPPYKGGIGNVASSFKEQLDKRGWNVDIITPQYDSLEKEIKNTGVLRYKPIIKYGNAACLPQILCKNQYNLIHLHYPFFGSMELLVALKRIRPKIRLGLTYHMDFIPDSFFKKIFSLHLPFFLPWLLRNIDFITISSFDYLKYSSIEKYHHLYKKKLYEIPFGPDLLFDSGKSISKKTNKNCILFVGALDQAHRFKGLDLLLKACQLIHSKMDFKLIIVGDGDKRQDYEQFVNKLGLGAQIEFKGRLSNFDLLKAYQDSDFLVLPSITRSEAFGIVLVNAFSQSRPVVASNLPGLRSVVDQGVNGLLVEPEKVKDLTEKLLFMLKNGRLRKKMGEKAYVKYKRRYQWPSIISKLEEIYKKVYENRLNQ